MKNTSISLMNDLDFDLKDLQTEIMGAPSGLVLPDEYDENDRVQRVKTIKAIVDMYTSSRRSKKVKKSTYKALTNNNPFVRVAAADVIAAAGDTNSFEILFKALEDEESSIIKQKIARSLDNLQARLANLPIVDDEDEVSLSSTARILSFIK